MKLSPREQQVAALLARETPNKQIAEQLGISVRTVEKHRSHIYRKLHCYNLVKVVHYALKEGLVENFYVEPNGKTDTLGT